MNNINASGKKQLVVNKNHNGGMSIITYIRNVTSAEEWFGRIISNGKGYEYKFCIMMFRWENFDPLWRRRLVSKMGVVAAFSTFPPFFFQSFFSLNFASSAKIFNSTWSGDTILVIRRINISSLMALEWVERVVSAASEVNSAI